MWPRRDGGSGTVAEKDCHCRVRLKGWPCPIHVLPSEVSITSNCRAGGGSLGERAENRKLSARLLGSSWKRPSWSFAFHLGVKGVTTLTSAPSWPARAANVDGISAWSVPPPKSAVNTSVRQSSKSACSCRRGTRSLARHRCRTTTSSSRVLPVLPPTTSAISSRCPQRASGTATSDSKRAHVAVGSKVCQSPIHAKPSWASSTSTESTGAQPAQSRRAQKETASSSRQTSKPGNPASRSRWSLPLAAGSKARVTTTRAQPPPLWLRSPAADGQASSKVSCIFPFSAFEGRSVTFCASGPGPVKSIFASSVRRGGGGGGARGGVIGGERTSSSSNSSKKYVPTFAPTSSVTSSWWAFIARQCSTRTIASKRAHSALSGNASQCPSHR